MPGACSAPIRSLTSGQSRRPAPSTPAPGATVTSTGSCADGPLVRRGAADLRLPARRGRGALRADARHGALGLGALDRARDRARGARPRLGRRRRRGDRRADRARPDPHPGLRRALGRSRAARPPLGAAGAGAGRGDADHLAPLGARGEAAVRRAQLGGVVPARRGALRDRPGRHLGCGHLQARAVVDPPHAQSRVRAQRRARASVRAVLPGLGLARRRRRPGGAAADRRGGVRGGGRGRDGPVRRLASSRRPARRSPAATRASTRSVSALPRSAWPTSLSATG